MFGLLGSATLVVHEVGVELRKRHHSEPALLEGAVEHTEVVRREEMQRAIRLRGGPQPEASTTTITYLTYGSQSIIANDDGLQAATAVLLFVVLLALSLLQLRGIGRRVHYAG